MALVLYMTNNAVSVHQEMSETSPGSEATSSPNTGWTVGKKAAGTYSKFNSRVEQGSGTFATTPVEPDGTIDTTVGDCLRSTNTYTGDFAAGDWILDARVIAVTSGGDQDGRIGIRVFRGADADGSGATEITSARTAGGTVTNLTTGAAQTSTATVSLAAVTLTNEYLFVQLGWEITGAGGANNRDVIFRIGTTATKLTTPDFSPPGQPTMRRWGGVPNMTPGPHNPSRSW